MMLLILLKIDLDDDVIVSAKDRFGRWPENIQERSSVQGRWVGAWFACLHWQEEGRDGDGDDDDSD